MIRSLYFHNPSAEGFERIIKFLHNRKYQFLSCVDLVDFLYNSKQFANKKLAYVSLDDGWRGNLQLLPIIEKYKVPITIFVALEPVSSGNFWWEYVFKAIGIENRFAFKQLPYEEFNSQIKEIKSKSGKMERSAVTLDELKMLAKHPLVSIQSHTINHPILTSVPDDVLISELKDSKIQLEQLLGVTVDAFSYPNGSLSKREVDAAKKFYSLAFSTEQDNIHRNSDRYLLPRYALTGNYYKDLLKLYGIWSRLKNFVSLLKGNRK